MLSVPRLIATSFVLRQSPMRQMIFQLQQTRYQNVNMKIVRPKCPDGGRIESYDEKNMRLNRAVAPYLTIYAPQMTSFLSILHRTTGIILTSYVYTIGLVVLATPHDMCHYITIIEGLGIPDIVLMVGKFCLALPVAYHYMFGIRHLIWDLTGQLLRRRHIYLTGYIFLLLTFAGAAGLTIL